MRVRVARNIAQETESIEWDDINMRANTECRQCLRQCAAGMCHTAYRQHPAIRRDALRLDCNAVGSNQLFWCLENRFRTSTGTGAGKGETFFQVLPPVFGRKHRAMLSSGGAVSNSATADNAADLPATALEVEITESMAVKDHQATVFKLDRLRQIGIKTSMDDFGTGHSSLSQLQQLPLDTLKVDQALVQCIRFNQLRFLMQQDSDEWQGFLFSKPLPADEFEVLLKAGIGQTNAL